MSGTPPRIVRQETKNKITTCKTPHNAVFLIFDVSPLRNFAVLVRNKGVFADFVI